MISIISEELLLDIKKFLDENYEDESEFSIDSPIFDDKSDNCLCEEETSISSLELSKNCSVEFKFCTELDAIIEKSETDLNFQNTLQKIIAEKNLENSVIYKKAFIDRKFFSKIISNKNYVPKKKTVMALGLALELKLEDYETFLNSAGYSFMPSSKFDLIIKYCVTKEIFNLINVDEILNFYNEECFAPE